MKKEIFRFRVLGYSEEQFNRVVDALITLLSHTDADFRLIAATNLANLGEEIKAIDLALLNLFLNDPRVCSLNYFSFFLDDWCFFIR